VSTGHRKITACFGFDPERGIPSDEAFYQRVHPEDRDRVRREVFLERPDEGSHFDVDFRIVVPEERLSTFARQVIRFSTHPAISLNYVGTSIDVTERKQLDEERERLLASERTAFAEAVAAQQRFRDLVNSVEALFGKRMCRVSGFRSSASRPSASSVTRWNAGCPNRHSGKTTSIQKTKSGPSSSAKTRQLRNATTI